MKGTATAVLLMASVGACYAETPDSNFCRACTKEMKSEVSPYLPRNEQGQILRPVDDTTVMHIYRNLWKSAQSASDMCMNLWAEDRVSSAVRYARATKTCRRK